MQCDYLDIKIVRPFTEISRPGPGPGSLIGHVRGRLEGGRQAGRHAQTDQGRRRLSLSLRGGIPPPGMQRQGGMMENYRHNPGRLHLSVS